MFVNRGWSDVSYTGKNNVDTPNIEQLAKSGIILSNYYVQDMCSPTRASLMTGRYPMRYRMQHNVLSQNDPYGLPLNEVILPQELKRLNYSTHMIGKWHLGFYTWEHTPTYRYFDSFFGIYNAAGDYFEHFRGKGYDLRNNTTPIKFKNGYYSTWLYGNITMNIINNISQCNNANPWFIYLSTQNCHGPRQIPKSYTTNETLNNIRLKTIAQIKVLDDTIGLLINELKMTNLWDNLLLIYSSDNGGNVNLYSSNYPLRGGKKSLWEGGIRVPAFINGGYLSYLKSNKLKNIPIGKLYNGLMHVSDWLPTLCSIIGIKPTNYQSLDGYDMALAIFNNNKSPRNEILHNIDPFECQSKYNICGSIRENDYKLVIGNQVKLKDKNGGWFNWDYLHNNNNKQMVNCNVSINDSQKLFQRMIEENRCPFNGDGCMYDISNDPCEYLDIKDKNPKMFTQLLKKLIEYNKTQKLPYKLFQKYKKNKSISDPAHFDGFWTPWYKINSHFFLPKVQYLNISDIECPITMNDYKMLKYNVDVIENKWKQSFLNNERIWFDSTYIILSLTSCMIITIVCYCSAKMSP